MGAALVRPPAWRSACLSFTASPRRRERSRALPVSAPRDAYFYSEAPCLLPQKHKPALLLGLQSPGPSGGGEGEHRAWPAALRRGLGLGRRCFGALSWRLLCCQQGGARDSVSGGSSAKSLFSCPPRHRALMESGDCVPPWVLAPRWHVPGFLLTEPGLLEAAVPVTGRGLATPQACGL